MHPRQTHRPGLYRRESDRRPLPHLWMMTDERQGDALLHAAENLPRHAGIVFRHYSLKRAERRALLVRLVRIARRRRITMLVAGPDALVHTWQIDGHHGTTHCISASVHSLREIRAAERRGVRMLFLSPVFATRSHPGARPLGPLRFAALVRQTQLPIVALGGMDVGRARRVQQSGIYGWAAIDAWAAKPAGRQGTNLESARRR